LHGTDASAPHDLTIGQEQRILHNVFDKDGTAVLKGSCARGTFPQFHPLKKPQKLILEAVLRLDDEVTRVPVHELDIAVACLRDLQRSQQQAVKDRLHVGSQATVLSWVVRYVHNLRRFPHRNHGLMQLNTDAARV